jgi:molybdopterin-guanine dinucleotide biosynthesis protein A
VAREAVTGVLLVGGASRRFGSPKALAELDGEALAVRVHRVLEEAFPHVIAVGKAADGLPLPFRVEDDGSELRASLVGIAAGLRLAPTDLAVIVPTDVPFVTAGYLRDLAAAAEGVLVAHPESGPLPGAYRREALPVLERRVAAGRLAVREAAAELAARVVSGDPELLRNVNTPADLAWHVRDASSP